MLGIWLENYCSYSKKIPRFMTDLEGEIKGSIKCFKVKEGE